MQLNNGLPQGLTMMDQRFNTRRVLWAGFIALFAIVALSGVGCSGIAPEEFIPQEVQGQEALTKALDVWKEGKKPEEALGTSIRFADTKRKAGQVLKSYEILGELPAESGRRYEVKLILDNPPAEEKAQYVVVGIDPLWIFRQEDYDMMTHWDHPMPDAKSDQPSSSTSK